jgi:hypothetical protein
MRNFATLIVKPMALVLALASPAYATGKMIPTAVTAASPTQAALPSEETMVILIRSTIVALNQANLTNNYSVLNALGSRTFRMVNQPSQLSNSFQAFRANRIDLAPVSFINPTLTTKPNVAGGNIRLVGYFPSKPMQVNFDLTFEPDEGSWKVLGMSVNLSTAQK